MLWFNPDSDIMQVYSPPEGWTLVCSGGGTSVPDIIAPVNTVPPVISGAPRLGQTLTLDDVGTWTGNPGQASMIFTRQWMRNDIPIPNANGPTFLVTGPVVLGDIITCAVTASNGISSINPGISNSIGPIGETYVVPVITSVVLSGPSVVGSELVAVVEIGAGFPLPTISYTWSGVTGTPTGNRYTILPEDAGASISVSARASNIQGDSSSVSSNSIGPVVPADAAPTVASLAISGNPVVGQTLTAVVGPVAGYPAPTLTYTWTGVSGTPTGNTYVPVSADSGKMIGCSVVATNSVGSSPPRIATTVGPIVIPSELEPPRNITPPALSGYAVVSQALTATSGTWNTITTPNLDYQWQRNGVNIPSATGSVYILQAPDVGALITWEVRATNANGSTMAETPAVGPISAIVAPANTIAPVISGTPKLGNTLTVSNTGTWTGQPPQAVMTYTYQWQRNGANIAGATGSTYVTTTDDYIADANITCVVTANNGLTGSASSNALGPVFSALSITNSGINFADTAQPVEIKDAQDIVFGDLDNLAGDLYEVTFAAPASALLSIVNVPGLTFTAGDGTDDILVTFTGTLADVNAANLIIKNLTGSGSDTVPPFGAGVTSDSVSKLLTVTVAAAGYTPYTGTSMFLQYGQSVSEGFTTDVGQPVSTEARKNVLGITQDAAGAVFNVPAHGYVLNDEIVTETIGGMTQINNKSLVVVPVDVDHFSVKWVDGAPVDSSAFTAFTSGGTVRRTLVAPRVRMFNGGARPHRDDRFLTAMERTIEESTQLASLVPARERISSMTAGHGYGEVGAYAIGQHVQHPLVFAALGRAALPAHNLVITEITQGIYHFNNALSAIRAMRQHVKALGESVSQEMFLFYKGLEADGASSTGPAVQTALRQMIAEFTEGAMYALQLPNSPILRFMIDQQAWGATPGKDGEVTVAALDMFRNNELIMVGPTYWCPWFYNVNDPHWRQPGYRKYWEHVSRVTEHVRTKGWWKPCYINGELTRTGNDVFVPIYVPEGALVIDTTYGVTDPGNYGFVHSASAVNAVAIVDDGSTDHQAMVKVTLASGAPGFLEYAYNNGLSGRNGPTVGPRGNLRDSSTFRETLENTPIYNWLCRDRKAAP
jgi:hypothetical protein